MSGYLSSLLASTGFIVANKTLIRKIGLSEAVLIGELCSELNYWKEKGESEGGWFFSTVANVERETGIKKVTQATILNKLQGLGLLEFRRAGLPPKRYIRLDFDAIAQVLNDDCSEIERNSVQKPAAFGTEIEPHNKNNSNKNKKNNITITLEMVQSLCEKESLSGMSESPSEFAKWFWSVAHNEDGTLNYKGRDVKTYAALRSVLRGINLNGQKFKAYKRASKTRTDEVYF